MTWALIAVGVVAAAGVTLALVAIRRDALTTKYVLHLNDRLESGFKVTDNSVFIMLWAWQKFHMEHPEFGLSELYGGSNPYGFMWATNKDCVKYLGLDKNGSGAGMEDRE